MAMRGMAGQYVAWQDTARQGDFHSGERMLRRPLFGAKAPKGKACRCLVWQGWDRRGPAWRGLAWRLRRGKRTASISRAHLRSR